MQISRPPAKSAFALTPRFRLALFIAPGVEPWVKPEQTPDTPNRNVAIARHP
jgi:hypothetical protein